MDDADQITPKEALTVAAQGLALLFVIPMAVLAVAWFYVGLPVALGLLLWPGVPWAWSALAVFMWCSIAAGAVPRP